jgi:carboxymethylenebutenolidase
MSDSKRRASEIRGELMMVFGRQDPHVPDEGRRAIYAALSAANVRFTWHELNAAHAFMRDEGPRYDPALTTLGYALALEMFDRTLTSAAHTPV